MAVPAVKRAHRNSLGNTDKPPRPEGLSTLPLSCSGVLSRRRKISLPLDLTSQLSNIGQPPENTIFYPQKTPKTTGLAAKQRCATRNSPTQANTWNTTTPSVVHSRGEGSSGTGGYSFDPCLLGHCQPSKGALVLYNSRPKTIPAGEISGRHSTPNRKTRCPSNSVSMPLPLSTLAAWQAERFCRQYHDRLCTSYRARQASNACEMIHTQ